MSIRFDFSSAFENVSELNIASGAEYLTSSHLDLLESKFKATLNNLKSGRASGLLPFFDLPFDTTSINLINSTARQLRARFDNFVLLGIGGSALGATALHEGLNHGQHNLLPREKRKGSRYFCLDNVDPDFIRATIDVISPEDTLVNVISKSGGTAETIAEFLYFKEWFQAELGDKWREHIVVTTGTGSGFLQKLALDNGLITLGIDDNVGGRFSVLSSVGLFPAAMTGIDIEKVCEGARTVSDSCLSVNFQENPAAMLAAILVQADLKLHKPIHVFMSYANRLFRISDWFRQLWAESLGKKHDLNGKIVNTGPTPVRALGATDQHSQTQLYIEGPDDKVIVFIGTKDFETDLTITSQKSDAPETDYFMGRTFGELLNAERRATEFALNEASRINFTIELDRIDERHLGALMYILETSVLFAGAFYNVNPLDQPGVEAGKLATYALMGKDGYSNLAREIQETEKLNIMGVDIKL